jgi:hypothetical protein
MTLQAEYYIWHAKYHDLDSAYGDISSPLYLWVAQRMFDVCGLRTLEAACGRRGFVRALAPKRADAYGLDFPRAALRIGYERSRIFRWARSVFLRIHTV